MDVNGSRYHLLQGARDWLPLLAQQSEDTLWWDDRQGSVGLAPRLLRFPHRPGETPPALADRRGAARDRYGNLHWIDTDRQTLRVLPSGGDRPGEFWNVARLAAPTPPGTDDPFQPCPPPPPPVLPRLRGLTITHRHFMIVGTLAPAGLLIFDLHGGGPPQWRLWPRQVPFAPFDLAPAPDGGVWILDRGPEPGESRLWRLDRYLRVVPLPGDSITLLTEGRQADFRPVDGEPVISAACHFPLGTDLGVSASPLEIAEPVAVVALGDGSVLVLESDPALGASMIHRYRDGLRRNVIPLEGDLLGDLLEVPTILAHDMAFLPASDDPPGRFSGELYLVAGDGNQAFDLGLTLDGDELELFLQPRYLPLRRFTGKGLVEAGDEVRYDLDALWPPLAELPRRRYASRGVLEGLVLDGRLPDTVWHRLVLDGTIPPGDRLRVECRCAEERAQLADSPWQSQPPLYRRHAPEIPFHQPFTPRERQCPGTGTWELLLDNARGRFLELRLTLEGSGRSTPRLRALRVWYPRFSYLERYLPAAYRDDPASADFLERWLANPEGLLTTLEGAIAGFETLLDSRTAPKDYLNWLAGWLGALLDPDWDESRRRLFVDHIELLFRWRGTPLGLLALLDLELTPCPDARLFEPLRRGRIESLPRFGGRTVRLVEGFQTPPTVAHRFTVLVPVTPEESEAVRRARVERVKAIVTREKPAHTRFDIQPFWALFQVGSARLGLDTVLGEGSRYTALVLDRDHLGGGYLAPAHPMNVRDRRLVGRDAPDDRPQESRP